ncbi:hypothetical protein BDV12DRAFT_190078 [Aspergillus spectabilis]
MLEPPLDTYNDQAPEAGRPQYGPVLMLNDKVCVKYGRHVQLYEEPTLRSIAQHTSIPVPKVLCALADSELTYIVMGRIQGNMLGDGWEHRRPKPNTEAWSFRTVQDFYFHWYLRHGLEFDSRLDIEVQSLIRQQSQSWLLMFTHGDLNWERTTAKQAVPTNAFWVYKIDRFVQPWPKELFMEKLR